MAASRSMLEALLARVQKRAAEPRNAGVVIPPLPVPHIDGAAELQGDTLPPAANISPDVAADVADEDIEEYDEELIEIIDDAEVIPQAAAAARAIDPSVLVPNGAGRSPRPANSGGSARGASAAPAAAASAVRVSTPAAAPVAARPAAPVADVLRGEALAPRPVVATQVAHAQGSRRELRASSFIEALDASLKLG